MKTKHLLASLLLSMSVSLESFASNVLLVKFTTHKQGEPIMIVSDTQYSFSSETTLGYSTITLYDKSGNELYSTPAYIAAGTSIFTIPSGIAQQIDYVVVEYNDDILCGKAE